MVKQGCKPKAIRVVNYDGNGTFKENFLNMEEELLQRVYDSEI